MEDSLLIEIIPELDFYIVKLTGQLTINIVRELKTKIKPLFEKIKPRIIYDWTDLDFLDSSGLGVIFFILKHSESIAIANIKRIHFMYFEGIKKWPDNLITTDSMEDAKKRKAKFYSKKSYLKTRTYYGQLK